MPRFYFEDSYTVHRLIAVDAETEEEARQLTDYHTNWKHEEETDAEFTEGFTPTTLEAFHTAYGEGTTFGAEDASSTSTIIFPHLYE